LNLFPDLPGILPSWKTIIIGPSAKVAVLYDELLTSGLDESKDRLVAVKEKSLLRNC
jgi:hypothetical protein